MQHPIRVPTTTQVPETAAPPGAAPLSSWLLPAVLFGAGLIFVLAVVMVALSDPVRSGIRSDPADLRTGNIPPSDAVTIEAPAQRLTAAPHGCPSGTAVWTHRIAPGRVTVVQAGRRVTRE